MEVLISGLEDGDTPDKEYLFQRMTELLSALWKERKSPGSEKEAEKELKQLQEKRELLVDKLLEGVLTDEMYQAKQMQLEQRQKEIRMQLEEKKKNKSQNMEADRMTKIESYLWTQGISQAVLACFLEEIEKIVIYPGYMEVFFSDGKLGGLRRAANGMKISNNKLRIAYGTAFRYRERKQEEREKILILMRENPEITARQIAEIQKVSMSAVNYRIRILKKENRVRFCGKGGKGHWEVLDPVF